MPVLQQNVTTKNALKKFKKYSKHKTTSKLDINVYKKNKGMF